ncbi:MAG: DUF3291 domain-containing protein [Spirosomataceae bacterium]
MYLAQLNIARLLAPIDHPQIADFVAQIPSINALAEQSEGFVWRLKDEESDNATGYNPFGDPLYIVNMSVWTSIDTLRDFAFRSAHRDVMKDRNNWFEKHLKAYLVLWWVPVGHEPTLDEAKERLNHLQQHGESPFAFTFKVRYDAEGNLV